MDFVVKQGTISDLNVNTVLQMSFKRKLHGLGHPAADKIDVNNQKTFRDLVSWLEDMKIR